MAWVVKSWEASPKPNEKGEYVRIVGRQEGLVSWFLSLVGIDPTIQMVVTDKNFRLEARTFWGYAKRSIPISRISEVRDGFERPWLTPLIFWGLGVLTFLFSFSVLADEGGFIGMLGMWFLAAIFFGVGFFIYHFWRFLVVGVVGFGGSLAITAFKPSLIEGQSIDASAAERVGVIIQALVDMKSK